MRKTLSVLAIITALSSSAYAESSATLEGGTLNQGFYVGDGNVTIAEGGSSLDIMSVVGKMGANAGDLVSDGTVTMTGGTLECSVNGGMADSTGNATSNTVTISGGSVSANVYGGSAIFGHANNNTVTISGGSVNANVYGGSTMPGNANNNTVTISGGAVQGNVYGGSSMAGNASNNTVNLVGAGATLGELTGSSFTIDGMVNVGEGNTLTNNTLNVYGKGITVENGIWANTVNFYLAPGTQNGDIILTMSEGIFRTDNLNVKCSGETLLTTGDKVTLIHVVDNVSIDIANTPNVDIIKGVTATYSGKVAKDGTDLVLTVGDDSTPGVKVETNTMKSMTETRTDVAALVNSAADFMATTGVQQAKLAAKVAALTGKDGGVAPFVALGGSSLRYNTGSHVDANGFNGALGVAKAIGNTTLGIAGEYGTSDYKSYVGHTNAKGDSKLYGAALLADWQGKQGWHAESALRLGRTSTDYSAMTALGGTHYTDHASYQGIMIGGGKEISVSKKSDDTVDLYARYLYGHTNGSNTKATSGEGMHFSSVNSHRTLVGARYNHELTDSAVLYAGAAWMHEFNGDAHAIIGGFRSPSPSLEGDSGMVEIGTTFAPLNSDCLLLNLNLQGWTGVQRGITGGAGCTIKF